MITRKHSISLDGSPGLVVGALLLCTMLVTTSGCNSFFNSWFDPTQVGSFTREATMDIRTSLSIQDTPMGLAGATEPQPEDLIPIYEEYRIGPGDVVTIRVFELLASFTETNTQSVVDEIGTVSIPELGTIRVAGLTRIELEKELVSQLASRGILPDARVTVDVLSKRQSTYVLFGAISQPNVYPIGKPDLRLLEALNYAGGLVDSVTSIYVFRNEPRGDLDVVDQVDDGVSIEPTDAIINAVGGLRSARGAVVAAITGYDNGQNPPDDEPADADDTEDEPAFIFVNGEWVEATADEAPAKQPTTRDVAQERAELIEAVAPPAPDSNTAAQPAKEAATVTEVDDTATVARPRFIFVNGEWVETAPDQSKVVHQGAEEMQAVPETASPVQPQVDWSKLAGDEEARVIHVSADALRNGDYRHNIVVRPQDSIRVIAGEYGEYYIMGQIGRPGAYSITGRQVTLKTAIASAGNLAPLAWPDRCTIYRRYGDREEMHQVNLDAIFAGKEPDVFLKNNDLVLVGTHPAAPFLAVFRNAFRFTYGFGFVYDRNFGDIDSYGAKINPNNISTSAGTRFPNLFR